MQLITKDGTAHPAPEQSVDYVTGIRVASRAIVRELGFMQRHLAGTDLSAAQVHALLDLEADPTIRATDLTERLRLDKSVVSRLLADLVKRGYISTKAQTEDGREKKLRLTAAGASVLATIHRRASRQINNVLQTLPEKDKQTIMRGLNLYAEALKKVHRNKADASSPGPKKVR
jgi:DNA-binding MarR family transcriptional regulator